MREFIFFFGAEEEEESCVGGAEGTLRYEFSITVGGGFMWERAVGLGKLRYTARVFWNKK